MKPSEQYQLDIKEGKIEYHLEQAKVVAFLDEIDKAYRERLFNFKKPWQRLCTKKSMPIQGLYLYGNVGAGKTYLMDIFYHHLPAGKKERLHFHRFMREVQEALKALQGKDEPLEIIARDLAKKYSLLCFDEFYVSDIADAMILKTLIAALFKRGVILVATSNIAPEKLYEKGLQRAAFLPVIDLIKQYTRVFYLETGQDYRLRLLRRAGVYFSPLDEATHSQLSAVYAEMTWGSESVSTPLQVEGREISVVKYADSVAWFDFSVLCHTPRSQRDYLDIAENFNTVLLSNVPQIQANEDNKITYLIFLVDIFYEHRVKLLISAAVAVDLLYPENARLSFEFQRTKSRLLEMQTAHYLGLAHRTEGNEYG